MRVYSSASEEALRARSLLKDWADEGRITGEQYRRLEQDTVSDLRTTNIFLRLVLLLFTLVGVAAAIGLFFFVFLSRPSQHTVGIVFMVFSGISYAAAETVVQRGRLYRSGIEEALAALSVGLLYLGMEALFFSYSFPPKQHPVECVVPAIGAFFSLWIWHRFGLWYFFLAAMVFVLSLPGYWTTSHAGQHVIVAALYAAGLILLSATRTHPDLNSLKNAHSLAEAFLWLGIYLEINLKASALALNWRYWLVPGPAGPQFARPFYWSTWVVIWCLPPLILTLGIRRKDRFVIAAGAIAAVVTFVSNKPYLGPDASRHSPGRCCHLPPPLAPCRSSRGPLRLHRRERVCTRRPLARCQPLRNGPGIAAIDFAANANQRSRRAVRRRGLRRRRCHRRLLKPIDFSALTFGCPIHAV